MYIFCYIIENNANIYYELLSLLKNDNNNSYED